MKKILITLLLFISVSIHSQKELNNYQYVIVANQFPFLKSVDQYKTSSLTKFLLNKAGFKAYFNTDVLPNEVNNNRCSILNVTVLGSSGFFTTKNYIEFKDCNGRVVYKSIEGRSKKKLYKEAYYEAIRAAFKDPVIANYKYIAKGNENIVVEQQNDMPKTKVISNPNVGSKTIHKSSRSVLYAQATVNGFQLVDTTPKIIFSILKTATSNLYVIKDKDGVLYKKGDFWVAEYYKNNTSIIKEFYIKF